MTIAIEQLQGVTGKVYSNNSEKVGNIGQIYLDDQTGEASWVTVKTGLFGTSETFAPLAGGRVEGDDLYLGVDEDKIKNAPRVEADGSISPEEEADLYSYYNLGGHGHDSDVSEVSDSGARQDSVDSNTPRTEPDNGSVDRDVDRTAADGPATDEAMTRSEEQLNVGTATRESGRARLRKYVTTETVTETVPVRHEEVTLEREPITEDTVDASQSGPAISEEEHEVVLHEEVPVVEKEVVAAERIKLGTKTVADEATVSEDVRKENVELVDPENTPNDR